MYGLSSHRMDGIFTYMDGQVDFYGKLVGKQTIHGMTILNIRKELINPGTYAPTISCKGSVSKAQDVGCGSRQFEDPPIPFSLSAA